MPGQQRQDNDRTRRWMRQLERERLDALSIAEGEGPPGPGAVAASAHRPAPRSASDDPRQWRRQLERDRLSMTAMSEGTDLPGPGAAGAAQVASPKGMGTEALSRVAGLSGGDEKKHAASLAQMGALIETIMKKALPVLKTRASIYTTAPAFWVVPNLIGLHFHKLMKDGVIKDAAIQIKAAAKQIKLPLPPQARLVIWAAPMLPSIEWLLVIVLDAIVVVLLLVIVVLLAAAFYCSQHKLECLWEAGDEAATYFSGLF